MKIEQAVLRGVESFGMLCSAHECGWVAEPGECWSGGVGFLRRGRRHVQEQRQQRLSACTCWGPDAAEQPCWRAAARRGCCRGCQGPALSSIHAAPLVFADGVLVVMPDDAEVGEECPDEPPEVRRRGAKPALGGAWPRRLMAPCVRMQALGCWQHHDGASCVELLHSAHLPTDKPCQPRPACLGCGVSSACCTGT